VCACVCVRVRVCVRVYVYACAYVYVYECTQFCLFVKAGTCVFEMCGIRVASQRRLSCWQGVVEVTGVCAPGLRVGGHLLRTLLEWEMSQTRAMIFNTACSSVFLCTDVC